MTEYNFRATFPCGVEYVRYIKSGIVRERMKEILTGIGCHVLSEEHNLESEMDSADSR